LIEKERYTKIEEQLKNFAKSDESSVYRKYFFTLLNRLEFSFQFNTLIDIFRLDLAEIPEIKAVYYFKKSNKVAFWAFS